MRCIWAGPTPKATPSPPLYGFERGVKRLRMHARGGYMIYGICAGEWHARTHTHTLLYTDRMFSLFSKGVTATDMAHHHYLLSRYEL